MLALLVSVVTFASSVLSPASGVLSEDFHASKEVTTLTTSLFVLGFAFGPMLFGPASEVVGRKYPLSGGMFVFAVFIIPVAVSRNLATVFVCRFLSGVFGAAPLAIVGTPISYSRDIATLLYSIGTSWLTRHRFFMQLQAGGALADIWSPLDRGVAVAGFASATFLGPVLGPIGE